jgi:hypothetical protein
LLRLSQHVKKTLAFGSNLRAYFRNSIFKNNFEGVLFWETDRFNDADSALGVILFQGGCFVHDVFQNGPWIRLSYFYLKEKKHSF